MILLFSIALKLPTLHFPHPEPDEQIYLNLASRILTSGSYNLQETQIIYELSPAIYDRPLFFHPPLFPATLVPFVYWKVPSLAVVISWLGHLLCIVSVAMIGRRVTLAYDFETRGNPLLEWLPVIGVALDPLLTFVSRRLWIDSLLAGLCAASLAAFFCARYSPQRRSWLVAGGILFGLAALSKATAFLLAPLVIYLILTPEARPRSRFSDLCLGCLPALLLALPWYITFYSTYGVLVPTWIKPDEWMIQHYPFMRTTLDRTPGYYLLKLAAIAPVGLFALGAYCLKRQLWTNRISLVAPAWFLLYFIGISYAGLQGIGFQMRYIAPLAPSIYLMLSAALGQFRSVGSMISVGLLLLVIVSGMTSAIYLVSPHFDEIYSLFELTQFTGGPS